MKWPQHLDYIEAIQHPTFCFAEPALRQAKPVCDRFGVPRAASGNFACVFQVVTGRNRWAVRCFTRAVPDVCRRYAMLTQHLSAARVSSLVGFSYLEKGIRIRGNWHPVLKMEWVEGVTLPGYVEAHLDQPLVLRRLAHSWNEVAKELRHHRIAHGDLQHGNILVMPDGGVRLVDYDAMYVPAFRRELSPELGHPNWQHPSRAERDYDENLDDFASLVLATSLDALAVNSSLWRFHNGENLLFTRQDFEAPRESKLFRILTQMRDRNVQRLAEDLESRCLGRQARSRPSFFATRAAPGQPKRRAPGPRASIAPTLTSRARAVAALLYRLAAPWLLKLARAAWASFSAFSRRVLKRPIRPRRTVAARAVAGPPDNASRPWYQCEAPATPARKPGSLWHQFRNRMARDTALSVLVWVCVVCGTVDLIVLGIWWLRR